MTPDADRVVRYFPVPDDLAASAAAAASAVPGADQEPAAPRVSATVMLVRDAAAGIEVFMLRRPTTMRFAPGRMVFPGGGVDERDADPDLPWCGPDPAAWAEMLGATETQARELVVAAAREVFEECGVLLAGADAGSVVGDVSGAEWARERDRLLAREQSFAEVIVRRGLVLRTDLLHPWAHWVTPEFEHRRHDTRFFAAELPEGQRPDDRTTEADLADWFAPADVLADAARGDAALLPPTVVCLEQAARAESVASFLASAPPMARTMPVLHVDADGARLRVEVPARGDER